MVSTWGKTDKTGMRGRGGENSGKVYCREDGVNCSVGRMSPIRK